MFSKLLIANRGEIAIRVARAAQANLIGIATVAVGLPGLVAPWGGAEGILGTNPFAYGVPLEEGSVVTDFATSTMAEGAARLALRDERQLPDGMFIGPDGQPSTDPHDLFGDPPGALLPFGGPVGYKGYALNILPELGDPRRVRSAGSGAPQQLPVPRPR